MWVWVTDNWRVLVRTRASSDHDDRQDGLVEARAGGAAGQGARAAGQGLVREKWGDVVRVRAAREQMSRCICKLWSGW